MTSIPMKYYTERLYVYLNSKAFVGDALNESTFLNHMEMFPVNKGKAYFDFVN